MWRFVNWRSLFRRGSFERDMADEFAFHLQARRADLMHSGLSAEEAGRQARLEFGGRERYRAECRESHRVLWLDELHRNFKYALRNLHKAPAFSITAVLSLALGLAAISITFALVDTVLLRPLPFAHSDRIVTMTQKVPTFGSSPTVVTVDEFLRWKKSGLFESAALIDTAQYTLEDRGRPERIYGASVTPEFLDVFHLKPLVGRDFSAEDATEGSRANVVILSHQLWVRRFHADPGVIGRTVHLSGAAMTVIGIMPAEFDFPRLADISTVMNWAPEQAEFWVPFVITPKLIEEGNFNYFAIGRLRAGVMAERAAAQMRPMAIHLFREQEIKYPEYKDMIEKMLPAFGVFVLPLRDTMTWGIRDVLWMLFAAVAVLILLVLFNLGNLLLTRNAERFREYTVRQALGAGRSQLFRQSLCEQLLLVGFASVFSAAFTMWGLNMVRTIAANKLPRLYELRFSLPAYILLLGLAFLTAIVFGALSQVLISSSASAPGLNAQSRTATSDRKTNWLRAVLVTTEVAASMVLLVAAGLLVKSFQNVLDERPGFNPQHVLTVKVPFNSKNTDTPEKRIQHMGELVGRLDQLPGVESASLVHQLPLTGDNEIRNAHVVGKPYSNNPDNVAAEYRVVGPDYFRTMQIPVIAGRVFRAGDPAKFAVIGQTMAKRLWPSENPLGKQFMEGDNGPFTVIGVVGDVHNASLEKPVMMEYYRLLVADPFLADNFVIRTAQDPESLIPDVQKVVWQLDPSEPVTRVQTMEHLFESVTLPRRFETGLLGSFAVVALFLSGVGLFGIASLSASKRTREFGIRMAIGATTANIVRLELAQTAIMVTVGLFGGLLASLIAARLMGGLLYRVRPWNAQIFFTAAIVLIGSAVLAGWLPARRASHIDPAAALRSE